MFSVVLLSCLLSGISSFPTDHLIARRDTTSADDCFKKCSREVNMVCGNDDIAYPNSCLFDCARVFLNKDLESIECPFDGSKGTEFLYDLERFSDQNVGTPESSLVSKESKATQVFPNSKDQENIQELGSLIRLIRKVEEKEEENDDNLETSRMSEEATSPSNELGREHEKSTNMSDEIKSMSVKSLENVHQNIWNALYALRKANQKLESAKHAKLYVLHELDNIASTLKDDGNMSHDSSSKLMSTVERLLEEEEETRFPFKRHLSDYPGLKNNFLSLYNFADNTPVFTTQLNEQETSLNVGEKEQYLPDMVLESSSMDNNEEHNVNNEELAMNNEGHSTIVESITASDGDIIEYERSHSEDDSFKKDTEYTDAPDVFPSTETLENYNKRISYDFGPISNNDDDDFTIPFLSQAVTTEDDIVGSDIIDLTVLQEFHRAILDNEIDKMTDTIDTVMEEAATTEFVTNVSFESSTANDALPEQTTSEFVEEDTKTELPENIPRSSQTISQTDHIPVLESSDDISMFEILDTVDNNMKSEESTAHQTEEKVKIKSRNRISDSNELFVSSSEDPVGKPEPNTVQPFEDSITESNEFTDFYSAEDAQRDSTSATETDISALLTSNVTNESSQTREEDTFTTESTDNSSVDNISGFGIDATSTATSISTEVTTTLSTSSDYNYSTGDLSSSARSTEDILVGAVSDPFVHDASVTSEVEMIETQPTIFIPHPVTEGSDYYGYPDTSESIDDLFVGDESMNLPNYLNFVDRPRPILV